MSTPANKPADSARPPKDMSGFLAKNDRRTNDRQPEYRGKVLIQGKDYLLSAWVRDDGMLSIAVTDPATLPARTPPSPGAPSPNPTSTQPPAPAAGNLPAGDPFGDIFGTGG